MVPRSLPVAHDSSRFPGDIEQGLYRSLARSRAGLFRGLPSFRQGWVRYAGDPTGDLDVPGCSATH